MARRGRVTTRAWRGGNRSYTPEHRSANTHSQTCVSKECRSRESELTASWAFLSSVLAASSELLIARSAAVREVEEEEAAKGGGPSSLTSGRGGGIMGGRRPTNLPGRICDGPR
jgi:2-succinyl-5-enolpyruvyl-6-hydroxy-3-cyclohexene-1-carboxylate synthase